MNQKIARSVLNGILSAILVFGGLTWVPGSVAQSTTESAPYVIEDPVGDVGLFGAGLPSTGVSLPPTDPVDIVEGGITDEDEVGLRVYMKIVKFEGDPTNVPVFFGGYNYYEFRAELAGTQIRYYLEWFVPVPDATANPSGKQPVGATFCFFSGSERNEFGGYQCDRQNVVGTVDWDQNLLEGYVSKSAFMGLDPIPGRTPAQFPPVLEKGSQLNAIYFRSYRGFPWFSDSAPDQEAGAQPYVFQTESANTKIRLRLDSAEQLEAPPENPFAPVTAQPMSGVSVTPGQSGLISIRVENTQDSKRIINLTAKLDENSDASLWKVHIAPTVQVPAGDARVVNLIVNASKSVLHRDSAVILVRGQSLGVPDELGALRIQVVASVPPGPERKTLYFHAADPEGQDELVKTFCNTTDFCWTNTWLNTLETDEKATRDAGFPMSAGYFNGLDDVQAYQFFQLDTPLTTSLLIDPKQPIEVVLSFKSTVSFDADVGVEISTVGRGLVIASGSGRASITSTASPVTLTMMALASSNRIVPEDGGIMVTVSTTSATAGTGAAAVLPGFHFIPKQSRVTLPFIPDPQAKVVQFAAGPAFISLNPLSDREEFVNPGKTKVFNATVVNEGIEADDAQLTFTTSDPAWQVEIRPGMTFHLPSGDGAKFGILAKAPGDAKEGDQLLVVVNATSAKDPTAVSSVLFVAIVTTGIEIPDEAASFEADAESASKVRSGESKKSPGPALLLLLTAPAIAVALRRRFG